jgi:hypothetical protein
MVLCMNTLTGFVQWAADTIAHNQVAAVIVAVVVLLFVLSNSKQKGNQKDPSRLFSSSQRASGFSRAANRCEFDKAIFWRCRKAAQHGDHWFPHSKGGATSMTNFVAACAPCNLSKSAKNPTRGQTARLKRRRRKYFPAGMDSTAGEWYRLGR